MQLPGINRGWPTSHLLPGQVFGLLLPLGLGSWNSSFPWAWEVGIHIKSSHLSQGKQPPPTHKPPSKNFQTSSSVPQLREGEVHIYKGQLLIWLPACSSPYSFLSRSFLNSR